MAQVIWTEPALSDLEAIAEYIALDNRDAAAGLVKRVFAHIEMLASNPQLGPRIPELRPESPHRQIVEPLCRVFYRYHQTGDKIFVLAVMRGERLFQARRLRRRDKPTI
jgi:plasmid stabilization system protein ParE